MKSKLYEWLDRNGLDLVVGGMLVLSVCVTTAGVERVMSGWGYDAKVGLGVGIVLELAKDVLPVHLLALWARRARGLALALGLGWTCLAIFSCLATHSTVATAITSKDRTGSWKMEVRTNAKIELSTIEQQLAALSRPSPPRPVKTVRESMKAANVLPAIWKDSRECAEIQGSPYFAKACAQVVQLRRELAASEDYERLSLRAADIRKTLAEAPIVATADPLPTAFDATLGWLRIGGAEGIALLLTMAIELISGFGLAGMTVLGRGENQGRVTGTQESRTGPRQGEQGGEAAQSATKRPLSPLPSTLPEPSLKAAAAKQTRSVEQGGEAAQSATKRHPASLPSTLPEPTLKTAPPMQTRSVEQGGEAAQSATKRHPASLPSTLPEPALKTAPPKQTRSRPAANRPPKAPSNVIPMRPRGPSRTLPERDPESQTTLPGAAFPQAPSHVPAFAQQRLRKTVGASLAAKDLRAVYEAWCTAQGYCPLSLPKLAAELGALGYSKWKSCGVMRYRDVQLVA